MNDTAEHHPLIVRLAREIGEYVVGDLSNTYNELALRRVEKTLSEIEEYSMAYFGVIRYDQEYDRWSEMHEDIGLPLETLTSQLGEIYVRVGATYARSRDHVNGASVDERIAELEDE